MLSKVFYYCYCSWINPWVWKRKRRRHQKIKTETKIGSFLKIKKERDSLRLLSNSWLRPEVIVCSSSHIYKRIAKKTTTCESAEDMRRVIRRRIISTSKQITTVFTPTNSQFYSNTPKKTLKTGVRNHHIFSGRSWERQQTLCAREGWSLPFLCCAGAVHQQQSEA